MGKGQSKDYGDGVIRRRLGDELASVTDGGERLTMFASTVRGDILGPDVEANIYQSGKRFFGRARRLFSPQYVKNAYHLLGEAEDWATRLRVERNQKIEAIRGRLGKMREVPLPNGKVKTLWAPLTDDERRRLTRQDLKAGTMDGQPISTLPSDDLIPDQQFHTHQQELDRLDAELAKTNRDLKTHYRDSALPGNGGANGRRTFPWGKAALYTTAAGGAWWLGNKAVNEFHPQLPGSSTTESSDAGSVSQDWAGQTRPSLPGEGQQGQQGPGWYGGGSSGSSYAPITPAPVDIFHDDDDHTDYSRDITAPDPDGELEYRGGSGEGLKRFAQVAGAIPPQAERAMQEVEAKDSAEALLAPYGGDPLNMIVAMMHGTFGEMSIDQAKATLPDFDARARKLTEGMQTMAQQLGQISQRIEHSTHIDFDHLQKEAQEKREQGPEAPPK